jgi:LPXTG-motif cell wall-anchored protein
MKKFLMVSLILSLLMSIASFGAADGASLGTVPQTTADIAVDATKDDIYDKGLYLELTRPITEGQADYGTKGEAWVLFKDGILYAYVHVNDSSIETPDPAKQESSPWETESVEIFVDANNSGDVANVLQYRIDVTNWPCVYTQGGQADYGPDMVKDQFKYASKLGNNEYWLEYGIPVAGTAAAGKQVGFQFQINDRNEAGSVQVMSPSSLGSSSWTAETYDYIVVGDVTAVEEVEVVEELTPAVDAGTPTTPAVTAPATTTPAPTAPQTGDTTMLLIALAGIALIGAIIVTKKVRR